MTPLVANLVLAAATILGISAILVLGVRLIQLRQGNNNGPEGLEFEIVMLQHRLEQLERQGRSRKWITGLLLWRGRQRLAELNARKQRLEQARERWTQVRKGVQLPAEQPPARSTAIQPPPVDPDSIRR